MEQKINRATNQRPDGDRVVDAPLVTIDLENFMKQIKSEESWKDSDRNAITVFKTEGMNVVLVALHKEAEMPAHKANGILTLQVIEGKIIFATESNAVEVNEGHMVTLHENIPHRVVAEKESVFLLTIASNR